MNLWHGVIAPGMTGTAVKQSAEREPETPPYAAALDRLLGIGGAAWKKAAGAWK